MRARALRSLAPAVAALVAVALPASADPLQEQAARRRAACEAIEPRQGQTGMVFNPPELQTVYDRSACYQSLALLLRDKSLCRLAVERRSWIFDGSGISPDACAAAVRAQVLRDAQDAGAQREQHVTVVEVVRNGNGRDYDVLVGTSGGSPVPHRLTVALAVGDGGERVVHSDRQPLGADGAQLRILLRGATVEQALAGAAGHSVQVTARLDLQADTLEQRAVLAHRRQPRMAAARSCVVLPAATRCGR